MSKRLKFRRRITGAAVVRLCGRYVGNVEMRDGRAIAVDRDGVGFTSAFGLPSAAIAALIKRASVESRPCRFTLA